MQVLKSPKGWYILFAKDGEAQRAMVLNNTAFRGNNLTFVTEAPAAGTVRPTAGDGSAGAAAPGRKAWQMLTIGKKNRPNAATTTRPNLKSPPKKSVPRRPSPQFTSSSSGESELSSEEEEEAVPPKKPVLTKEQEQEQDQAKVDVEPPAATGKKRPAAKPKAPAKAKKAKLDETVVVEIAPPEQPPVAEIQVETPLPAPAPVKPKPKKAAASPVDKLIESGTIADEEDAYWLGQALQELEPVDEEALALTDRQEGVPVDHPLYHQAGSWRAEGWKSIPKIRKSEYLPQQNKAAVAEQEAGALTTGRTARVTGRRLAHDIETSRKSMVTTATQTSETDTFAFNQLRTRKKQLKFSRSPIEGYGLYAMETILPGEMVCEYVGEIVRSAVADVREQRYTKQGIGSSYLFRIDNDVVCDATFRGSVRSVPAPSFISAPSAYDQGSCVPCSRLINHSCDPSASAKIITINGQSKVCFRLQQVYTRPILIASPDCHLCQDGPAPRTGDPV